MHRINGTLRHQQTNNSCEGRHLLLPSSFRRDYAANFLTCALLFAPFTATFLTTAFFRAAFFVFSASRRLNAHRRFVAAMMAFLPAADSLRFGFCLGAAGSVSPRTFAHLARCAIAIRRRAAVLIFRRLGGAGPSAAGECAELPLSRARSLAICSSRRVFWASNPSIAAVMISSVSLFGTSLSFLLYPCWHILT